MICKDIQFEKLKTKIHFNNDLELFSKKELLSDNSNKGINFSFTSNLASNIFPLDPIYVPSYTEILVNNNNDPNLLSLKEEKQLYKRESKETQNNFKVNYIIDKENNKPKNKIFNIAKILKKGRYKKNSGKKGKHNKYNRDNIIRRFKVHLMNSIFKYINNSFSINNSRYKSKINVIKKISSSDIKSISKEDNIKWLNSKVKDVFSTKLTSKIVTCDIDYNIKLIKRIINKGKDKKVILILNKTIRQFLEVYINNDIKSEFLGFETIKHDINILRNKGETEKYIKLFINVANNFENIFNKIISRKRK